MTHVDFTTSGVALTKNQVSRIREIIEYIKRRSAWDKGAHSPRPGDCFGLRH